MKQLERLKRLNEILLKEMPEYKESAKNFPNTEEDQFNLHRALCNVRPPEPFSEEFLKLQDELLQEKVQEEKVVDIDSLIPTKKNDKIYIWQGDITKLNSDAIVNAANSQMLGCFIPLHNCIDNIIHTKAGVKLRAECNHLMQEQGYEEPVGRAKLTKAYNLPSKYVIHTVGPQVGYELTQKEIDELKSSYNSILKLADENNLESIAFCCISTGVFRFPNEPAAEIAVSTVEEYLNNHPNTSLKKIIFNVFKDEDLEIYNKLLEE